MAKQLLIEEKTNEANLGFDGSWVVHPALVQPTLKCFSAVIMNAVNQKYKLADIKSYEQVQIEGSLFPNENSKVGEDYDLSIMKEDITLSIRVCLNYYF